MAQLLWGRMMRGQLAAADSKVILKEPNNCGNMGWGLRPLK